MANASIILPVCPSDKNHSFIIPSKKIHEGQDVNHFLTSKAYGDLMTFLLQLNRAMFPSKIYIENKPSDVQIWELNASEDLLTDTVKQLQALLDHIERIIDEVPPDEGPRRFGNVSFRKWYQKVEESAPDLLRSYIPPLQVKAETSGCSTQEELLPYFLGSFGSAQRLDYGSGHELSFLAFLGCIWKLGGFETTAIDGQEIKSNELKQSRAIVLGVLADYFRLIRRLIRTYTLEPAGSHGVWGLDDHSFLPYIFGSAQYGPAISDSDQTPIEGSRAGAPDPADVAKAATVQRYKDQNLYFGAIGFIHDVKRGPFWEHSPMLYDISGVKAGWGKINKGMIKMYAAEVLGKFPVVQHFPFGSLFSWDTDPEAPPAATSIHTSSHPTSSTAGDNKVSSSRSGPPSQPATEQVGTRAPWATSTGTSHAVSSGAGVTGAPWTTARPSGLGRATAPGRNPTTRGDVDTARNAPSVGGAMPPPTRAPWAKNPP